MIAVWRDWAGSPPRHSSRIASSLGLFAGHTAPYVAIANTAYCYLPSPRLKVPHRGWRPYCSPAGKTVLLHGRIDNAEELASIVGQPSDNLPAIYAAAVERWGDDADLRIIGSYCAVVASKGALRLARSPWDAPPLHYCRFEGQAVVASVPRVLLAAGLPARLDQVRLADNLYFNLLDRTRGWYEGAYRVAYGTVVTLEAEGIAATREFYDPLAVPPVRFRRDDDYVEAAETLLADATRKALKGCQKPGIMLSGGLDSPIVAVEVLRQLPDQQRLPSFTFAPCDQWDGILADGHMGDERPFVRAFAELHPRIEPHFTQNEGIGFDARWSELFTAMGTAPNHLCNFSVYHGVWRGAQDAGCDLLLTADFANQTFSNDGRWAYVEFLLRGKWRELALAVQRRPGDTRSFMHKLGALSLLRLLPGPLRRAARRWRHPRRTAMNDLVSMLPREERRGARARAVAADALIDHEYAASHSEALLLDYRWRDCEGAEVRQGFEQLYGLRQVDVPAYRPLAEFCAGLPTRQFMRHGESRWLARRMALGKMPEAQRNNPRYGRHNVDWHARMTPRIEEFRKEIASIAADPTLDGLIDVGRMSAALTDWPASTPLDPEDWMPRAAGLARGLLTARFVAHVSGRNTR